MNARNKYGTVGQVSGSIRELLERRTEFQGWLSRLEELGADYRPAVAARVRADYEERLAAVSSELEQHRSSIENSLEERKVVREEASLRFEEASAEIEELELRFHVGELDESTWEKRREDHVSGLESIAAEVEAATTSVSELEAVLADLDGTGPSPARQQPEPEAATVVEVDSEAEPEVEPVVAEDEPVVAEAPTPAEPASKEEGSDFLDELEFLESLSLDDADSFDAVSRMLEDEES